jgi:DNA-directed RNA polymerase subunit M/transcription elongation factor TFIIS
MNKPAKTKPVNKPAKHKHAKCSSCGAQEWDERAKETRKGMYYWIKCQVCGNTGARIKM